MGDQKSLEDYYQAHKNDLLQKGEINMKFQIIDQNGNVVDKNLTYEEAMLWINSTDGKDYIMKHMEDN